MFVRARADDQAIGDAGQYVNEIATFHGDGRASDEGPGRPCQRNCI